MSPVFSTHEAVVANPGQACPAGFFSDGVPHTKKDSFIAFYFCTGLTEKVTCAAALVEDFATSVQSKGLLPGPTIRWLK
eukprot:4833126-Pyramimonas_sp.AAC.1